MITFRHKGNFKKTLSFFERVKEFVRHGALDKYGDRGVKALQSSTPLNTGKTAESWNYEIHHSNGSASIVWTNSNENEGIPIVVLIQYGHGTRNGGYVQGRDFINPAMRPVFDSIAEDVWKEVSGL